MVSTVHKSLTIAFQILNSCISPSHPNSAFRAPHFRYFLGVPSETARIYGQPNPERHFGKRIWPEALIWMVFKN